MKDQELYFRQDTLYITGDRYEFKKVKKRPLGIKLRRFFSVKIVVVVLFLVLSPSFIEHRFSIYPLLVFVCPVVIIFSTSCHEIYKDMVLWKEDIISMKVKDRRLIILYRNESGDPSRYAKELELQSGRYSLEELGEALGYALRQMFFLSLTVVGLACPNQRSRSWE